MQGDFLGVFERLCLNKLVPSKVRGSGPSGLLWHACGGRAHPKSTPAHSLFTLSTGPLFFYSFYVVINILCLKFSSNSSLSRNPDPWNYCWRSLGFSISSFFLLNLLPPRPRPQHKLWHIQLADPSDWKLTKNCQLIFFLSFFFFFPVQLVPKCDDLFCSSHWSFCFLLFQPPAGFPTWCWVIWCRCSERLVFMSLADGLGKLHDVPAAPSRLSRLSLIQGASCGSCTCARLQGTGWTLGWILSKDG